MKAALKNERKKMKKKKIDPQQVAENIFNLFLKETETNAVFRIALRNFISAIEAKENEWIKEQLGK